MKNGIPGVGWRCRCTMDVSVPSARRRKLTPDAKHPSGHPRLRRPKGALCFTPTAGTGRRTIPPPEQRCANLKGDSPWVTPPGHHLRLGNPGNAHAMPYGKQMIMKRMHDINQMENALTQPLLPRSPPLRPGKTCQDGRLDESLVGLPIERKHQFLGVLCYRALIAPPSA